MGWPVADAPKQLFSFDRRHKWGEWTDEPGTLWMRVTCASCGAFYRQQGTVALVKTWNRYIAAQLTNAAKVHRALMSKKPMTMSGGGKIGWGFSRSEPKATAPMTAPKVLTDCQRVLLVLENFKGLWVSNLYDLTRCMVHSRIAELRRRGHQIECKHIKGKGWCYRLLEKESA